MLVHLPCNLDRKKEDLWIGLYILALEYVVPYTASWTVQDGVDA